MTFLSPYEGKGKTCTNSRAWSLWLHWPHSPGHRCGDPQFQGHPVFPRIVFPSVGFTLVYKMSLFYLFKQCWDSMHRTHGWGVYSTTEPHFRLSTHHFSFLGHSQLCSYCWLSDQGSLLEGLGDHMGFRIWSQSSSVYGKWLFSYIIHGVETVFKKIPQRERFGIWLQGLEFACRVPIYDLWWHHMLRNYHWL